MGFAPVRSQASLTHGSEQLRAALTQSNTASGKVFRKSEDPVSFSRRILTLHLAKTTRAPSTG